MYYSVMRDVLLVAVLLLAAVLFKQQSIEITTGAANHSKHRHLQQSHITDQSSPLEPEIHGKTVEGPSVIVNMLRRAREPVSDSDVPFLLEVPHTASDTIYNILTTCYGLRGKRYMNTEDLARDKRLDAINKQYVSSHVKPTSRDYFHFVSTPHFQEGAALFTQEHRGRIMLMMRHPCIIGRFFLT
jgi:hypothetical protein